MQTQVSPDAVVVSDVSFRSDEPGDIIESNISFLNALFEEYVTFEEVSADALRSYFVDYYLAQVNNGGFSQFVYNSRWRPEIVSFVREGLPATEAKRHLVVFEEGARLVERFGQDRLEAYFTGGYFGENPHRDELNGINERLSQIDEEEDLLALNAAWLRNHPKLVVLAEGQMQEEIRRRAQTLPDRERRVAEARADAPRYLKLIWALCEQAGHELQRVTAGDPTRVHEGIRTLAWHFITDKVHHHMVEAGGKAFMFRGDSTTDCVCEVEAPEQ